MQLFPPGGQGTGLVHLCRAGMAACAGQAPGRQVVHVEQFRMRSAATINEVWFATDTPDKRDKVQELRDKLLDQRVTRGAASVEELVAFNLAQKLKAQSSKRKKNEGKTNKKGSISDSDDDQPTKKKAEEEEEEEEEEEGRQRRLGLGVLSFQRAPPSGRLSECDSSSGTSQTGIPVHRCLHGRSFSNRSQG